MTKAAADCPACRTSGVRLLFEGTDRLYRTTEKKFRIVECAYCGLLRLDPRPGAAELARYYPENYWLAPEPGAAARLEENYRRFVLRDHLRFVRRALKDAAEDGPVLDVGCGGGLFLRMLKEEGVRVAGMDFSPRAAAIAWRGGVPAMCANLPAAPLKPASCAAITMFHVLEHLEDPYSYLEAARALLKPRGRLIVQVPNVACWQFLLLGENWSGLDVPRHLIDFRTRDVENLVEAAGFQVLRRKHFSLRDNPAAFATSVAPGLDPMARRIRRIPESGTSKLYKDLVYLGLVVAALPISVLEATCRAGASVMLEAQPKP